MNKRVVLLFSASLLCLLFAATFAFAAPAEVPRSGQTTVYSAGDDGELQTGVPWPSPRFTNPDGSTPVNGSLVVDQLTGLMWTQNGAPGGSMTWQAALNYVAGLNANNYLGHNDWRLPDWNELESLTHTGQYPVTTWLNGQSFTNVQAYYYWSSSTYAGNTTYAWLVFMYYGYEDAGNKTGSQYVWPVRGGQNGAINLPKTGQTTVYVAGDDGDLQKGVAWPSPRFTAGADTSVTDNLTGLIWAPNGNLMPVRDSGWDADGTTNDGRVTWQHALDYVAKLNNESYLGYNDWRLPNRKELRSLANYGEANVATWLNGQGFTNVQAYYCWSSSTCAYNTSCAWSVGMLDGLVDADAKAASNYVWPVRGGQSGSFAYLTISKSGTGSGTVTVDKGAIIWSEATGTASYGTAMTVNMTAVADSGSTFTGWSGDADCSDGQVTMDSDKNCIVNFDVGVLPPIATVSPASRSYGNRLVGTVSAAKMITVTNTGGGALKITGISIGGTNPAQFAMTTTCPIDGEGLAAGENCTVSVKFKPTWAGTKSASLAIDVEAPAESKTVTLAGTGVAPIATISPASLSYPDRTINTISAARTVTVSNTGTAPLFITGISKTGKNPAQFSQAITTCPIGGAGLAAGASCTIKVKFKPTTVGAKSASLEINVSAPAASKTVTLAGTGML